MRSRLLPIVCAVFLVIAMTVQFFVSYSREKADLMQQMEYKMELAQKDFIFEMYDMHEATDEIMHYFPEFNDDRDEIYASAVNVQVDPLSISTYTSPLASSELMDPVKVD